MKIDVIKTKDGSNTLYIEELNEHYHSTHGAIQESNHVYIKHGLNYILKQEHLPSILEIGFGTGLNCFLTLNQPNLVNYTGIEKHPLTSALINKLNYTSNTNEKILFQIIHDTLWGVPHKINNHIFSKLNEDISCFNFKRNCYHLIYFDAFAPEVQPHLWTEEIFKKMYETLHPNGILITYCAKGIVKRRLKAVGFYIEGLPGPPGKREITRAKK